MQIAAFIGWQVGAGGKKSFKAYLENLGLLEKVGVPKELVKLQKELALKRARKIIELDKR